MAPDGIVTDRLKVDALLMLMDAVKSTGVEFGVATHNLTVVLPRLQANKELWNKIELLICPISKIGYYMRGPVSSLQVYEVDKVIEVIEKAEKLRFPAVQMIAEDLHKRASAHSQNHARSDHQKPLP